MDARFEGEEVSDKHRVMKLKSLNSSGHHVAPCVTKSNHTGCLINVFHDNASVNISCRIGILRHHDV